MFTSCLPSSLPKASPSLLLSSSHSSHHVQPSVDCPGARTRDENTNSPQSSSSSSSSSTPIHTPLFWQMKKSKYRPQCARYRERKRKEWRCYWVTLHLRNQHTSFKDSNCICIPLFTRQSLTVYSTAFHGPKASQQRKPQVNLQHIQSPSHPLPPSIHPCLSGLCNLWNVSMTVTDVFLESSRQQHEENKCI